MTKDDELSIFAVKICRIFFKIVNMCLHIVLNSNIEQNTRKSKTVPSRKIHKTVKYKEAKKQTD